MTDNSIGILRMATLQDVDGIKAVIDANSDKLLPRSRGEIIELLDSFYVIDEAGQIVGCCCLEVYSPKIAEVRSLAVLSDKRGHHYGQILVEKCISDAQQLKIRQILVVTSSPEFFERLNFGLCLNEKYAMFWNGVTPESYHSHNLSSAIFHVNGNNNGAGAPDSMNSANDSEQVDDESSLDTR